MTLALVPLHGDSCAAHGGGDRLDRGTYGYRRDVCFELLKVRQRRPKTNKVDTAGVCVSTDQ
jgi:hypothetical protein